MRRNDLRETPCAISEFIEVLLESRLVEMQRRGNRRNTPTEGRKIS
jgi:hypothetical protein